MHTTRRRFLVQSLVAAGVGCAGPQASVGTAQVDNRALPEAKKKILILGGTRFLGPQLVEAAKAHGHTLTLFNRGKTNPGLFPDIEKLHGDRDAGTLDA